MKGVIIMVMFVKTYLLTDEQKQEVSEMIGKIMLWILRGESVDYMAKELHMDPWQVEANLNEALYILRKQAGIKRFIKSLFWK